MVKGSCWLEAEEGERPSNCLLVSQIYEEGSFIVKQWGSEGLCMELVSSCVLSLMITEEGMSWSWNTGIQGRISWHRAYFKTRHRKSQKMKSVLFSKQLSTGGRRKAFQKMEAHLFPFPWPFFFFFSILAGFFSLRKVIAQEIL